MSKARGLGVGKKIMELCIDFAQKSKFKAIYLETFPNMDVAMSLYHKFGFVDIDYTIGVTGHSSCYVKMLKQL